MSDVAQATPVVSDVAATPTPVVEAPAPTLSAKDAAKAGLFKSIAAAQPSAPANEVPATPVTVDANGRTHAPDGKFLPGAPEQAAPIDPAAAVTPQPTPANTDQQTAPPKQVRIPVPEGHWLRSRGRTEIPVDPELERDFRGLLKDTTRSEVTSLREQLVTTQAQLRAAQEARQSIAANPDVIARINELRALGHDDLADAALAGLESKQLEKAKEYEKSAREQFAEVDAKAEALEFRDSTRDRARQMYAGPWVDTPAFETAFTEAMKAYAGLLMHEGENAKLDPGFVLRFMKSSFLENPENKAFARARIEARRQPAPVPSDAQARHATLPPLASIPSTARTGQLSTQPATLDKTGLSAGDIRKQLKRDILTGAR